MVTERSKREEVSVPNRVVDVLFEFCPWIVSRSGKYIFGASRTECKLLDEFKRKKKKEKIIKEARFDAFQILHSSLSRPENY